MGNIILMCNRYLGTNLSKTSPNNQSITVHPTLFGANCKLNKLCILLGNFENQFLFMPK